MNNKKFVRSMLITALTLVFLVVLFNFAVDPLFQYHKPWFGMDPVITDERYQNAGIAKNFDFDMAILGNSMCENFLISDVNETFGGTAVKLTASGSYCIDWSYDLKILKSRQGLKAVLFNFDVLCMNQPYNEFNYELPGYLYDNNYLNDYEYLLNYEITKTYSVNAISANITNRVPDYNRAFYWADEYAFGKKEVLNGYTRKDISTEEPDIQSYIDNVRKNIELLVPYFRSMPNTEFFIFCSPFSMLYWDEAIRSNTAKSQKEGFLSAFEIMTSYDNVNVFFWTDDEMFHIMSDLDNYKDSQHYSPEVNKIILRRIKAGRGRITCDSYKEEVNKFFDYIEVFDYDSLFGYCKQES